MQSNSHAIRIHWFGRLREETGLDEEDVAFEGGTILDLYRSLRESRKLSYPPECLLVAVDDMMVDWWHPLEHATSAAFLPPMGGG